MSDTVNSIDMEILKIDVMKDGGGRFYKTLRYPYNPLFKVDLVQMTAWVNEQLPSIRNRKDIKIIFYGYDKTDEL